MFGEEAAGYMVVLFTCGDDLEADGDTIAEIISNDKALSDFIDQCGGRYHVFNNRDKDCSQVRELLEKINTMVQTNGGRYYTAKMFQQAERAVRDKMEQLQKEDPNTTSEEARKQVYGLSRPTGNKKCVIQ
ncbi:unnamed protein product [Oreochromis niloticus]|nr:unnamed protein product [Mustela putorius furo]